VNDEHLERVLAFNDDQRYAYFVAHACNDRAVYGLSDGDDDWLVWGDAGGERDVFPIWPHPRLALELAVGELDGFTPAGTDLDEFLRFLDELHADDLLVGVMPYPDGSQLLVEPEDLKRDLEDFRSGAYADLLG
jgi:hypothetical protein